MEPGCRAHGGDPCSPRRKRYRTAGGERESLSLIKLPPPATSALLLFSCPLCLLLALFNPLLLPRHVVFQVQVLYSKQSFHMLWVAGYSLPDKCLMLLRGGSPGTVPSNKERWTYADTGHDLIHLKSVVSAPCHQPFSFPVSTGLLMPPETDLM